MKASHIEFLVEEESAEAYLRGLLPQLLGEGTSFAIHPHQGKDDLIEKLPKRLRGYASWLPESCRIVVLVDRDKDDCRKLKQAIERMAVEAGLVTRSRARGRGWQVAIRIAVEELEAWFFGDWEALRRCCTGLPATLRRKAAYRDADAIEGGTAEALERVLQKAGHFPGRMQKVALARAMGKATDPDAKDSRSFIALREVVREAAGIGAQRM
mgnify:CR=1 FL=1